MISTSMALTITAIRSQSTLAGLRLQGAAVYWHQSAREYSNGLLYL